MEKLLNDLFDDYRGVILFIVVVILLSLLFTIRINNLNNSIGEETKKVEEVYYA